MLVDFIDKKKQNQKRLIQELEAQNVEFVSEYNIYVIHFQIYINYFCLKLKCDLVIFSFLLINTTLNSIF